MCVKNVSIFICSTFTLIIHSYNYFFLSIGGKAFTSKEFLKTHFDRKHFDHRIQARDDGFFECNICNRELKKYGHAERHMKSFHPSEESNRFKFEDSEVPIFNFFIIIK